MGSISIAAHTQATTVAKKGKLKRRHSIMFGAGKIGKANSQDGAQDSQDSQGDADDGKGGARLNKERKEGA